MGEKGLRRSPSAASALSASPVTPSSLSLAGSIASGCGGAQDRALLTPAASPAGGTKSSKVPAGLYEVPAFEALHRRIAARQPSAVNEANPAHWLSSLRGRGQCTPRSPGAS